MKKLWALLILLLIMPLTSCKSDDKADVYVSIYPLQFIAEELAKDYLTIKPVYPYGTDIHDYEPAPSLIVNMSNSKAIFYIGAGLEAFIEKAEGKTLSEDKLVKMSKYVSMIEPGENTKIEEDEHDDHHHLVDPHIWLDPNRMVIMTEKVYEKLCEILPEKVEKLTENKNTLISKLKKLDFDFREMLKNENILDKVIVVDHDAYLYWEDAYGIKRIRTRLDNDSCTVIPSNFIKNIETIKQLNIKYITTTANASSCNIINQYISEAGIQKEILYSVESITKDQYKAGQDYIFLMYENLKVLEKILPRKIR